MENKNYYSSKIINIIARENKMKNKDKILDAKSFKSLLSVYQRGSKNDLKTAYDRYETARTEGFKINQSFSKYSMKKHEFLTSLKDIDFEPIFIKLNREERLAKSTNYKKGDVVNYFKGEIPENINSNWDLSLEYTHKKLQFFLKDMKDLKPYKTSTILKVEFIKSVSEDNKSSSVFITHDLVINRVHKIITNNNEKNLLNNYIEWAIKRK